MAAQFTLFGSGLSGLGFRWKFAFDELESCNIKKSLVYPSISRLIDIDDIGLQNECTSLRKYKVFEDTGKRIPQFISWNESICEEFQESQFSRLTKLKRQKDDVRFEDVETIETENKG